MVGFPFRPLFDSLSFIKNATVQTYGINIGYIHTFIFWKRFYTTISLVQGLGLEQTLYKNTEAVSFSSPLKGAAKINCRYAFGYNLGRFYIGTMGILDYLFFTSKSNTTFNFNTGKITAFIGYRFYFVKKERQILRALNLIDYRL